MVALAWLLCVSSAGCPRGCIAYIDDGEKGPYFVHKYDPNCEEYLRPEQNMARYREFNDSPGGCGEIRDCGEMLTCACNHYTCKAEVDECLAELQGTAECTDTAPDRCFSKCYEKPPCTWTSVTEACEELDAVRREKCPERAGQGCVRWCQGDTGCPAEEYGVWLNQGDLFKDCADQNRVCKQDWSFCMTEYRAASDCKSAEFALRSCGTCEPEDRTFP